MNHPDVPVLILASRSPRRADLLRSLGVPFETRPAEVGEDVPRGSSAREASLLLAISKARAVAAEHPDRLVLGADTVVTIGNRILGKPSDPAAARKILEGLSGRWHTVWTGVCFVLKAEGREISQTVPTRVKFRDLSQDEIDRYVATGEPLDKAGAYGIQGKAGSFVEEVDGSFDNVIGLPTERVAEILSACFPEYLGGEGRDRPVST